MLLPPERFIWKTFPRNDDITQTLQIWDIPLNTVSTWPSLPYILLIVFSSYVWYRIADANELPLSEYIYMHTFRAFNWCFLWYKKQKSPPPTPILPNNCDISCHNRHMHVFTALKCIIQHIFYLYGACPCV